MPERVLSLSLFVDAPVAAEVENRQVGQGANARRDSRDVVVGKPQFAKGDTVLGAGQRRQMMASHAQDLDG